MPVVQSDNVEWAKIVSASVVPVVIISACGLLCLAFYNRLAAIVSRLRGFQRERLREQELLGKDDADAEEIEVHRKLLVLLETQTARVTRRAKLIRLTLLFLLLAIALLLLCSMLLGLSVLWPGEMVVSVILFMMGLASMMGAIVAAIMELRTALEPAELESQFVSDLVHQESPPRRGHGVTGAILPPLNQTISTARSPLWQFWPKRQSSGQIRLGCLRGLRIRNFIDQGAYSRLRDCGTAFVPQLG